MQGSRVTEQKSCGGGEQKSRRGDVMEGNREKAAARAAEWKSLHRKAAHTGKIKLVSNKW